MEINTSLTNYDNIICNQQNSFAVKFLFYKNTTGDTLDISSYTFYMSARPIGDMKNMYNFSMADHLSLYQNELRLNIQADVFTRPGTYQYDILEVWPDGYTTITILSGKLIVTPVLTLPPTLGTPTLPPVIKTITVVQPVYADAIPVTGEFPYTLPLTLA